MKNLMSWGFLWSLVALLSSCSGTKELEGRLAPNPELSPNSETNNPSASLLPNNFPTTIPIYPKATSQENPEGLTPEKGLTRWSSSDSIKAIADFYQQQFQSTPWKIVEPFSSNPQDKPLIVQGNGLEIKISFLNSADSNTEFTLEYQAVKNSTPSTVKSSPNLSPSTLEVVNFSDLDTVPEPLRSSVQNLASLGILTPDKTGDNVFNPNGPISRRTYAKWLLNAHNKFYENAPEKQIRLGLKTAQPAFGDVLAKDSDFEVIQGLAEAGLIPSSLTGDTSTTVFRPDAPLTREDLMTWKVPLDTGKALPKASIDGVKETWGFQDTAKINSKALQALYADFQNGEKANVRRVFGYTTLFQPKKTVTRAEAAATLSYFGYQGDGVSVEDILQK
ncbi:S-layer homology domain-containing protein [Aphanothece sacrum]